MISNFRLVFIIAIILCGQHLFSQNEETKYQKYKDIVAMEIENDSLPNFIISIKNNLYYSEVHSDTFHIAENNLFLAKLYYKLNSYDIATEYNLKAIELFEIVKDTNYLIFALQNISAMYGYIGNSMVAIEYSNKNLKLCQLTHDTARMVGCHINLATSYTHIGNKKDAFEHYDLALKYGKKINDTKWLVFIYNNMATYYFYQKNYDSAKYYFTRSRDIIQDKKTNLNTAAIYANIAETEYFLGNYKSAYENAQTSIKYFEDKNMVTNAANSYQVLIKTLAKLDKAKDIPEYLDKYMEIQQETINKRKAEQTAKLKILYDIVKYEAEIDVLKTENELKESKLDASKLKLYLAGGIILLIIITLIITIIQNSRLKKSQKMIVAENVKSFRIEEENIKLKDAIHQGNIPKTTEIQSDKTEETSDKILYREIVELLDQNKLYKNPEFNLAMLAKELNTNRSYISKAINEGGNKTFIEFISDYRIAESKRLLCSMDIKQITIEAIGKEAGFNSKSTFFRVFKTNTGVTPSFFLNNLDDA